MAENYRGTHGAVVVVGHREAVGAGHGHGHQVTGARVAQDGAVDEAVNGLAGPSDPLDDDASAETARDRGLRTLARESQLHVVGHPPLATSQTRNSALHHNPPGNRDP